MKYSIKRFSVTGMSQSYEIHEETKNGKTKGTLVESSENLGTGVRAVKKLKYRRKD